MAILAIFVLAAVPANAYTVVVLKSQNLVPYDRAVEGFRKSTSNRVVEFDLKGEKDEDTEAILGKIDRVRPDMILAVGVKAALLAKSSLGQYPLVYAMVINAEKYQLVGGHIYGIPLEVPPAAQFALLKRIVPNLKTIGVIYDPSVSGELVAKARAQVKALGLSLETSEVHNRKDVPKAVHSLRGAVDAIWMVPDSTVYTDESLPFIFNFAFDEGLPFMAFSESFVSAGALLSLSCDYEEIGRQASLKIDEILNGNALSSKRPFKYRLILNLKTAKKINLEIPQQVQDEASQIYR